MLRHALQLLFQPRRATLRLLFGAVLISTSGVFVKLVAVGPTVSAIYRVSIGGVVLVAWLSLRGRMRWPPRAALAALVLAGAFFAADLAAWHQSIVYLGPGLATLLGNFQVFFMTLAGVFFLKETLSRTMLLAIPLAMVGLTMITGFEWSALPPDTRVGIALGLATALFYAGFMLSLRRAQIITAHVDTAANLAVACLISAAFLIALTLWNGEPVGVPSPRDGTLLVLYALVSQVFGWIFITSALGNVPAARVGLVLLLQPALSFAWDVLLFGRQFTSMELAGAAVALLAIYLGSRPARRPHDL